MTNLINDGNSSVVGNLMAPLPMHQHERTVSDTAPICLNLLASLRDEAADCSAWLIDFLRVALHQQKREEQARGRGRRNQWSKKKKKR